MTKIVIACNSLFGLEIYSLLQEINNWYVERGKNALYKIIGFLSDNINPFEGISSPAPVVGTIHEWSIPEDVSVVIGFREPKDKAAAVDVLRNRGSKFETIIGPWMLSFRDWLTIGEGSIVCPYSAKPGLVIGDFVTVIASMLSGHSIGDFSTILRFANIAGDSVGKYSIVGDHVFLPVGKKIGDNCMVGDGSIVSQNVKGGINVFGAPARKLSLPSIE